MRSRRVLIANEQKSSPPRQNRLDGVLLERLGPLGITFTQSPSAVLAVAMVVLWSGLYRVGGWLGLLLGFLAVPTAWWGAGWASVLLDQRRSDRLLPELALRLARSLRSGQPPERAIELVSDELAGGHGAFESLASEVRAGRPVVEAVESWLCVASGDAEQLLAAGLLIGIQQGGDLAAVIDGVGAGVRDDLDLDARRRVLLTQSRMSAAVLVALPLAFAAVASSLHGGFIYVGTSGLALLIGGLLLDVVGIWWMRSLMRGLR